MTQTDVVMLENRVDALRSVLYRPAWDCIRVRPGVPKDKARPEALDENVAPPESDVM